MARKNKGKFFCNWCGKEFFNLWKNKYCSLECHGKARSIIWRNKELVIDLYNKGLSCIKIGKKIGAGREPIRRKLYKWKIKVRNQSEALKGRKQEKSEIINRLNSRICGAGFDVRKANLANKLKREGKTYEEIYGKQKSREIKEKISGINCHFYINGNGKGKYPLEFSESLKNKIRKRDNYSCQECGTNLSFGKKLDIHHIDFNKFNNRQDNLITLCRNCHNKTLLSYNVSYWINYYKKQMEERNYVCA